MLLLGMPRSLLFKQLDCSHIACLNFSGIFLHKSFSVGFYFGFFLDFIISLVAYSFREKVDMAVRLFNALKLESQFVRLTVQEATNSVAVAYKVSNSSIFFFYYLWSTASPLSFVLCLFFFLIESFPYLKQNEYNYYILIFS